MPSFQIPSFLGLDLRPTAAQKPGLLSVCSNLVVGQGGALERRPALVLVDTVPADSVGLYVAGSRLRVAQVGGVARTNPVQIDALTGTTDTPARVSGWAVDGSGRPLLNIETATGGAEVHYIRGGGVDSRVRAGFSPARTLAAVEGRAWMLDRGAGSMRYSRLTDWSEWTEPGESAANLVDVARYGQGLRSLEAVVPFRGRVAVIAQEGVQVWRPGPDPADIALEQGIPSIGTMHPESVVGYLGDVLYLGHGMARTLSNSSQTLDLADDPFGVPVAALTRSWTAASRILGFVSATMGRLMLFNGTEVLVRDLIGNGGWTTWTLPVTVTDPPVEHQGQVYLRAGTAIYRLDDTANDDNGTPIPVRARIRPIRAVQPMRLNAISTVCTQGTTIGMMLDGRAAMPMPCPGRSPEPVEQLLAGMARSVEVEVSDAKAGAGWRLEGLALTWENVR